MQVYTSGELLRFMVDDRSFSRIMEAVQILYGVINRWIYAAAEGSGNFVF